MNKICLIGNLTADPDMKKTPNGISVCSFTLAVKNKMKDSNGETKSQFFKCNAWRKRGESCGRYLSKGKKCYVEGELIARTYEAKDGTTRVSLDVQVETVEFLSPKSEQRSDADESGIDGSGFEDVDTSTIPF